MFCHGGGCVARRFFSSTSSHRCLTARFFFAVGERVRRACFAGAAFVARVLIADDFFGALVAADLAALARTCLVFALVLAATDTRFADDLATACFFPAGLRALDLRADFFAGAGFFAAEFFEAVFLEPSSSRQISFSDRPRWSCSPWPKHAVPTLLPRRLCVRSFFRCRRPGVFVWMCRNSCLHAASRTLLWALGINQPEPMD